MAAAAVFGCAATGAGALLLGPETKSSKSSTVSGVNFVSGDIGRDSPSSMTFDGAAAAGAGAETGSSSSKSKRLTSLGFSTGLLAFGSFFGGGLGRRDELEVAADPVRRGGAPESSKSSAPSYSSYSGSALRSAVELRDGR